ncbi:purine-cytosine permease family protein [Sphingomonas oryzagri]|uniref:Cytosine permease n=1 Tax=Sphingomonas oryzagri TaxID=3042314 RepID=A0ABT6N258_9SPHN|nr:cytosine permease [Sphingomonas oryzagri]MDH7639131.1 cytosine permease [Sphingomonas oryzagri]
MAADQDGGQWVESSSIEAVPASKRHGHVRDLFTLWFTTNIAPLPIVTGAMAVQDFGLPLLGAASAIVLGHGVGGIFLAACSAQGPRLGLPQMIQSRGQFGRYGALVIVIVAALLYIGFFISNIVLAGKSIVGLAPAFPMSVAAIAAAIAAAAIGILGYDVIHLLNRIGMWAMGAVLIVALAIIVDKMPAPAWHAGTITAIGWFSTFSLAAVWQISYACYTSDYSRYLPEDVGFARPFWASYCGSVLGASASFLFGALAVAGAAHGADAMTTVSAVTGIVGPVVMLLFVLNIISHNALNNYGATLSLITMGQTFAARWHPGRRARILLSGIVLAGAVSVAVLATGFVAGFIGFVVALMIVLAPWATINLVDFYLLKHGRYDIASLFAEDGGIYGRVSPAAIGAYAIGIAVQLPFLSIGAFKGWFTASLGGVDIGWLIAIPATGLSFILLSKAFARTDRAAA